MSQIRMDSEDIAEIRNVLQVIQGNAQIIGEPHTPFHLLRDQITEQVKRIDGLLPDVKKDRIVGSGIV